MATKKKSPTDEAEATTQEDIEEVQGDGEGAAADESAAPKAEILKPAENAAPSKLDGVEYPPAEPDAGRPPFMDETKAKIEEGGPEAKMKAGENEAEILAATDQVAITEAPTGTIVITVSADWPFNDIQSGGVVFAKAGPTEMPADHRLAGEWKRNPYLVVKAKKAE